MAVAGGLLVAGAMPVGAVPTNSIDVGNLRFTVSNCGGDIFCSSVTLVAHGTSGITLTSVGPLVAEGDDLHLIVEIQALNGTTLDSLYTVLNGAAGASFGANVYDSTLNPFAYIAGDATATTFTPDTAIALEADLNATGGQILSFLVHTVPAPAALAVFLAGLAGLAGTTRRRALA